MSDPTKNLLEMVLSIVALVGAAVTFGVGLYQWKRSQDWQRAAKLDDFVQIFQSDPLLRLAAVAVDYTVRRITIDGRDFLIQNADALLALRDHSLMKPGEGFTDEQAQLRDAYDALLAFFVRIELGISGGLLDRESAKCAFGYYLKRFLSFDMHGDTDQVLKGLDPAEAVSAYIAAYGDAQSIQRLSDHFGLPGGATKDAANPPQGSQMPGRRRF